MILFSENRIYEWQENFKKVNIKIGNIKIANKN